MISYLEALELILKESIPFGNEFVPIGESFGRVNSENILADRDYPPFHRSAMDGFAISSNEFSNKKTYVYNRELHAGETITKLPNESTIRIMTGAPVPDGYDAVIKIEDTKLSEENGKKTVLFQNSEIRAWLNIAKQGEDAKKGDLLLPIGTSINISEISLLASLGIDSVPVFSLPKVKIISTGNEVVPIEILPLPHQIRDSNSFTITASLAKFKIIPHSITHVIDDESKMRNAVEQGLDSDILILSGGVSVGEKDLVPSILNQLGVSTIFHKTAIKPGKPIWFGKKGKTFVFGLPGNPMSVQTCFRILIDPFLRKSLGLQKEIFLKLPFSDSKNKKHNLTEFFPVRLFTKDKTYISPIPFNGSGDIKAGRFSDGLAIFPQNQNQLLPEEMIEFLPW
ncbi:molybdopterin molybdotransferase MoeA [Leptospira sp. WS39.C2]